MWCLVIESLPSCGRIKFAQALIPAEVAAQFASDRHGGDGRQLVFQVGIAERFDGDAEALQSAQHDPETAFGLDPAEDEMRMLVTGGDEIACNFYARVASLNCLLRAGQVPANESVDILSVRFFR